MGIFDFLKPKQPQQSFHVKEFPTYPRQWEYFSQMEKIEVMWSVLSNLKMFEGDQADQLESACKENIELYIEMVDFEKAHDMESPKNCPAFVRLAMLYEKQKRYIEGIDCCAAAIRAGAYEDHTKGKMYGRLARLIKNSGANVTPDVLQLSKGVGP